MPTFFQDLRFAVRQLWKSPGFTLAAILTLGIGIGANTSLYSIMDAIVLHPLAIPHLDRVVTVGEQYDSGDFDRATLANYEDWASQSHAFDSLAVRAAAAMSLTGAGDPDHVEVALTSANMFDVMRTQALLGRVFSSNECQSGRDTVAVLSYGFWQRRFGSDPSILGRKISLDQRVYTIIGVTPKALQYPSATDLFLPFAPSQQQLANRGEHSYFVVGRLRDGVTLQQAQAEMRNVAARLSKAYPATNTGLTVKIEPLLDTVNGRLTPLYFRLTLGATIFVLLVVCANVANLQFARGVARRPEIALRTALGASRWRVVRQLLTENVLLGLAGAAAGLLFAWMGLHASLATMPERVARWVAGWSNVSLNGRVLAFSLLLAVATGIVSGIAPALEALRVDLVGQLKAGSRSSTGSARSHRLRSLFAITQISLAVALVIGAALVAKGMYSMLQIADVYQPGQVLTFNVDLPVTRYDSARKQAAWYAASLEKLRALPGVKSAEVSLALPYSDRAWLDDCEIQDHPVLPGKFQSALHLPVSAGYFAELHIPVITGRAFTASDAMDTTPVAVVSRGFVAHFFPGENPLGRKIRMGARRGSQDPWLTIVGVVANASYSPWDDAASEAVYMSVSQMPPLNVTYAIQTENDPLALAPTVRKALAGLDPGLPLDEMQTYQQLLHQTLTPLTFVARTLGEDALIALLLAAIGIFGVMANVVAERTREIGVRLAMGAQRKDVLRMILERAGWLTAAGLASGLLLAFALARLAANLLRGVQPGDPAIFAGITAIVAVIALLSSWIPAHRASRIDPMVALRDE
jgi:putative ABC transport system permease protein